MADPPHAIRRWVAPHAGGCSLLPSAAGGGHLALWPVNLQQQACPTCRCLPCLPPQTRTHVPPPPTLLQVVGMSATLPNVDVVARWAVSQEWVRGQGRVGVRGSPPLPPLPSACALVRPAVPAVPAAVLPLCCCCACRCACCCACCCAAAVLPLCCRCACCCACCCAHMRPMPRVRCWRGLLQGAPYAHCPLPLWRPVASAPGHAAPRHPPLPPPASATRQVAERRAVPHRLPPCTAEAVPQGGHRDPGPQVCMCGWWVWVCGGVRWVWVGGCGGGGVLLAWALLVCWRHQGRLQPQNKCIRFASVASPAGRLSDYLPQHQPQIWKVDRAWRQRRRPPSPTCPPPLPSPLPPLSLPLCPPANPRGSGVWRWCSGLRPPRPLPPWPLPLPPRWCAGWRRPPTGASRTPTWWPGWPGRRWRRGTAC